MTCREGDDTRRETVLLKCLECGCEWEAVRLKQYGFAEYRTQYMCCGQEGEVIEWR